MYTTVKGFLTLEAVITLLTLLSRAYRQQRSCWPGSGANETSAKLAPTVIMDLLSNCVADFYVLQVTEPRVSKIHACEQTPTPGTKPHSNDDLSPFSHIKATIILYSSMDWSKKICLLVVGIWGAYLISSDASLIW